jgi:intracellular septation protein
MIRVLLGAPLPHIAKSYMQPLFDFLPILAFFIAYWMTDFQTAIVVIMIAMTIQVIATRLITGTVSKTLLFSGALVVGLGGISLLLQNDLIFKWKPTVLNWIFAVVFLGSRFIGDKTVVQRIMQSTAGAEIQLSQNSWRQLNLMWVVFFALAGTANIFVAYNFSEAVWVNFKLFGLLGITVIFVLFQAVWIHRRCEAEATDMNSKD